LYYYHAEMGQPRLPRSCCVLQRIVSATARIVTVDGEAAVKALALRDPIVAIPSRASIRAAMLMARHAIDRQHLALIASHRLIPSVCERDKGCAMRRQRQE
jgi:BarA-like signal transduction histidine kinase